MQIFLKMSAKICDILLSSQWKYQMFIRTCRFFFFFLLCKSWIFRYQQIFKLFLQLSYLLMKLFFKEISANCDIMLSIQLNYQIFGYQGQDVLFCLSVWLVVYCFVLFCFFFFYLFTLEVMICLQVGQLWHYYVKQDCGA